MSQGGWVCQPLKIQRNGVAGIPVRYPGSLSLTSKTASAKGPSGAKWRLWTPGLDLGAAIGLDVRVVFSAGLCWRFRDALAELMYALRDRWCAYTEYARVYIRYIRRECSAVMTMGVAIAIESMKGEATRRRRKMNETERVEIRRQKIVPRRKQVRRCSALLVRSLSLFATACGVDGGSGPRKETRPRRTDEKKEECLPQLFFRVSLRSKERMCGSGLVQNQQLGKACASLHGNQHQ
ncbi:hypothetical protein V8C42DRAFT_286731 [Trichoderma barbatum]